MGVVEGRVGVGLGCVGVGAGHEVGHIGVPPVLIGVGWPLLQTINLVLQDKLAHPHGQGEQNEAAGARFSMHKLETTYVYTCNEY